MPITPMTIAIEGSLGVGKTTVAKALAQHLGWPVITEDPQENPYLELSRTQPNLFAFPSQKSFLLNHFQQLEAAARMGGLLLDRSSQGHRLFARLYHELGYISLIDWLTYCRVHDRLSSDSAINLDLVLYLHASPQEILRRIAERGREFEQGDRDFALLMGKVYEMWATNLTTPPMLWIPTDHVDVRLSHHLQWLVDRIAIAQSILNTDFSQPGLTLFTGPMFAGKSWNLRFVKLLAESKGLTVQCFTHSLDTRFQHGIASHDGPYIDAQPIDDLLDLTSLVWPAGQTQVVVLDELQFFGGNPNEETARLIALMEKRQVYLVLAGLDLQFDLKPFGIVPNIVRWALTKGHHYHLEAICAFCPERQLADFTIRTSDLAQQPVLVGGAGDYQAACAHCHALHTKGAAP